MNLSRFSRNAFRSILHWVLLLGFGAGIIYAQTPTGSVTGLVGDSTGAVLGGAAVQATNVDTRVDYKTVSAADGIYVLPSLPVGRYAIRVTAQGFKIDERTGLTIVVDQHAHVDFSVA